MDGNEQLYNLKKRSDEAGLLCLDPTLTVQADKEDADINTIVARFRLTGRMPENLAPPTYQDYDGVFDFQSAQNAILEAEASFMAMPWDVRRRFDNDPQQFLAFAVDPANVDAMVEMGLAVKKENGDGSGNDVAASSASSDGGVGGDGSSA